MRKVVDPKTLTLSALVHRENKAVPTFLELERTEQEEILRYIKEHGLGLTAIGKKWFDILTGKFFAVEFYLDEEEGDVVEEKTHEFATFDDFYVFVNGDIYENACFFGCRFEEATIKQYSIDLRRLNFDAFVKENIDSFTFELVVAEVAEEERSRLKRNEQIALWFEKQKPITTYRQLVERWRAFVRKYGFLDAGEVFFSFLLKKEDPESIKDLLIRFVCENDVTEGLSFDAIVLLLGEEAGRRVIEDFGIACSESTKQRRLHDFRSQLCCYQSGPLQRKRRYGFHRWSGFYFLQDIFVNGKDHALTTRHFFSTLKEMELFADGNMGSPDPFFPIDRRLCPKTNDFLPPHSVLTRSSEGYSIYKITKRYDLNGVFAVSQKWFDQEGKLLIKKDHEFDLFFDFVHFLKKDLSNADLIVCEGAENLASFDDLNLDGLKVKSEVAEKLGLPLTYLPSKVLGAKAFESPSKSEEETGKSLIAVRPEDDDYVGRVSYIADIHLLHRFQVSQCKTGEDAVFLLRTMARDLAQQATNVNIIAGDTSSDFGVFVKFLKELSSARKLGDFFFTLGNHELWISENDSLDSIIAQYRDSIERSGRGKFHLIQNNLFFLSGLSWSEVKEEELASMSPNELREKCRAASIIIFGGIGFSGRNPAFNANNGIYLRALDRGQEIDESAKFDRLYQKVVEALGDKNLVVVTHMPMRDWGGVDLLPREGVVYVSGHDHRNTFHDDGRERVYADNQIGYKGQKVSFKKISIDFGFDWFADYKDGIYEIGKEDYEQFYRGIGEPLTFARSFKKLFLIKRDKTYMFLMQSEQGGLYVLNGGRIKRTDDHPLEYFYENLANYAASVKLYLSKFDTFQKRVSSEVKSFGGVGTIHGSIVDIDFYNHLYLNPLDGSITPYYALSIIEKYVYSNLPSLLKYQRPDLFQNFEKLLEQGRTEGSIIPYAGEAKITKRYHYEESTAMYKVSRILKGLQYTTRHNVVRLWNDSIIADASEANGKQIVSGILEPDSVPALPMTAKTKR